MAGQRVGYVRVSTLDQNTVRQLDGVAVDKTYSEKASGKDQKNRPRLEELVGFVREGDTVLVHSMDRLARNLDDLKQIIGRLTAKGVRVEFVKEGLTFTGDDNAAATFLLHVMGAFAEFERSLIRERQREGIALAKKRKVYAGRVPALTALKAAELRRLGGEGVPKTVLARQFGVSRATVYAYLRAGAGPRTSRDKTGADLAGVPADEHQPRAGAAVVGDG
ncbi:DNA invertase Pin-like site-specific DNA recombinase [Frondihabitans sp. PhB188]|uniref:recombinase family protein n=1 Tax=Frondihabitans sp. PhB188 TaxID=2485200 RepID=UPI000F4731BD|nr:recombinase family protein [Frondihabitans sp. PhB188]ROQ30277.1 DNA invertase Pin-like site-specific DNA recombinase [Frondihabitans sp. PhB188]